MKTDEIWNYLQNHNYFAHHRLYNSFQVLRPSFVEENEVLHKVVLDYGCGFGRHLAWFSNRASLCFGVEINQKILNETKQFIAKNGQANKV